MIKGSSLLKMGGIASSVLLLDIVSKWLVQAHLPMISRVPPIYPYGGIGIFQDFLGIEFSIVHEINKGAAWGAFADFQPYLMALRIVLIFGLLCFLLFFSRQEGMRLPLTLIIAGAIGNVIDYFIYGHVVDMFRFVLWDYYFPVFNVADSAIFMGVCWIFLRSLFFEKKRAVKTQLAP